MRASISVIAATIGFGLFAAWAMGSTELEWYHGSGLIMGTTVFWTFRGR